MSFDVSGDAYDGFMGRYSRELAPVFADFSGVQAGMTVLDVGCGSGVLTEEIARRIGADNVAAVDPSPLVNACAERVPGADVRRGAAEELPWPGESFDIALAQLVVHFMEDPAAGVAEMARVTRPGGVVAACVWDFSGGMHMLHAYWESASSLDPGIAGETSPFGQPGTLERLWHERVLADVHAGALEVETRYQDFDELWGSFLGGVGPAGQYTVSRSTDEQAALREEYRRRLGAPDGSFTLGARAWAVRGRVPAA
jgi:SAM-dependent methyltransferase